MPPSGPGMAPPFPGPGMPPPPPPKAKRTGLWLVLLLVVALGAGGAYLVTQGGDDEPEEPSGQTGDDPSVEPGSVEDLNVTDDGGGAYVDPIFGDQFGWAIVLNNTGEQTATLVNLEIEFTDADGNVVQTIEDYVGVLNPGEEVGLGGSLELQGIERFEVTRIEPAGWDDPANHGKLVTSNITHGEGDLDRLKVTFEADSTYDVEVHNPQIRVIFRNAEGELIGGVTDFSTGFLEPEGHFTESVEVNQSFPGIDHDKTEVFLEPGDG
jgi:hypothetical protein